MIASLLLSRVLGIVRDMVIAAKFGQTLETDAYRLAFQIPDLLFFLIAGGALSSAFIPVFSEYLHTDREDDAWHVFSAVASVMAVVVLGFIALAWAFTPQLTNLIAGGKPESVQPLIATMSRIILPSQFAFFIGGLMFGTLYARQVFAVPGLGPNIYNLGIIGGAIVLSGLFTPGVMGMSVGATVGAVVGNLLIPLWAMKKLGAKFRFTLDTRHPGVRKVFRLMVPVVFGLSLPGVYGLILQYFGTFYPVGANTALDFANKLMQAPVGVFGQSLGLAVFPALAMYYAQKQMGLYREQLASTLRTAVFLSIPVAMLMVAVPQDVVRIVFERGAFTPQNTEFTAPALRWFALGVVAWCMHPVLMRGYFAMQNTLKPVVLGTGATVVFVGLSLSFFRAGMAYYSLPLAGSISAFLLVAVMLATLRRDLDGLDVKGIVRTLVLALVASAAAATLLLGASWLTGPAWPDAPRALRDGLMIFASLVFAWVYYGFAVLLKMPETRYLKGAMTTRRTTTPEP